MAFIAKAVKGIKARARKSKSIESPKKNRKPGIAALSSPYSMYYLDTAFFDGMIDDISIEKSSSAASPHSTVVEGSPSPVHMQYDSDLIDEVVDSMEKKDAQPIVAQQSDPPQPIYRELSTTESHNDDGDDGGDGLSFVPRQNILDDITSVYKVGMLPIFTDSLICEFSHWIRVIFRAFVLPLFPRKNARKRREWRCPEGSPQIEWKLLCVEENGSIPTWKSGLVQERTDDPAQSTPFQHPVISFVLC